MQPYIETAEEKKFIELLKQTLPTGLYKNYHDMAVAVFSQLFVGYSRFPAITSTAPGIIHSICNAKTYPEDSLNEIVGYAKEKFLKYDNTQRQDSINALGVLNFFINQNHQVSSFGSQPTILKRLFDELLDLSPAPSRAPSVGSSADGGSSVSISQVSTRSGSNSPSMGDSEDEWSITPDSSLSNVHGLPLNDNQATR